jgi:hypothetical protein
MNYTEEKVLEKAKKILKDLQKEFYIEENIENVWFQKERSMREDENKTHSCWIVVIGEPLFGSSIFLTISDETGEPLYIQSKHKVSEIEKDSDGNYFRK